MNPIPLEALKQHLAILGKAESRVLDALAFWKSVGHEVPTRAQVGMVAGYAPGSGNFGNILSKLSTCSMIDYPQPGRVSLLQDWNNVNATDARDKFLNVLSSSEKKVLDAFAEDRAYTRDDIGRASGYEPKSGNFGNILSRLTTLGVIKRAGTGMVQIEPWVREVYDGR